MWQLINFVNNSRPSCLWGFQFVQQRNEDSQFLVYDPSSRKQWTLTLCGNTGSWDSYSYQCDTKPCVFQNIEPQIPFNLIHKNREKPQKTAGNIRGRRNNRSVATQRFKPTSQLLRTKNRGECIFSYGKQFFYLDNDMKQPIIRRLMITAPRSSITYSQNTTDLTPKSNERVKWSTSTCFGHKTLIFGGTIVDLSLPQGYEKPLQFLSPTARIYDFASETWFSSLAIQDVPPRAMHSATCIGNRIFIIGGFTSSGACSNILIFNTSTMSWMKDFITTGEAFSGYGHSAIAFHSQIIVWGGITTHNGLVEFIDTSKLYVFDTTQLHWRHETLGNTIIPRFCHGTVCYNNMMYTYGGLCPDGSSPEECFGLDLKFLNFIRIPESTVAKDVEKLRSEKKFSDISILLHEKEVKLHKFILEYRAPEFLTLVCENSRNKINFSEYDAELYSQALQLIYSDYCQVSHNQTEEFEKILKSWSISRALLIDNSQDSEELPVDPGFPLVQDMKKIFKNSSFCDVTFTFEGETEQLNSHKALLSIRSSFFRALFEFEQQNIVHLKTVSISVFKLILEYILTDSCNFTLVNVLELFEAADHYDLERLKLMCASLIVDNLEDTSVITIWLKSKLHNCPQMGRFCVDFVLRSGIHPSRFPEFHQLPKNFKQELLNYYGF